LQSKLKNMAYNRTKKDFVKVITELPSKTDKKVMQVKLDNNFQTKGEAINLMLESYKI
jgi:hypothetical protein